MSELADGFYFDLASPLAYLAAERVLHVLPAPLQWQPVLAREQPFAASFDARGGTERESGEPGREILREEVERRVRELALQPMRWPDPFPFDSSLAMRVATYAKSIGRVVPFAQAAFRQAFAGGHALEDPDVVLVAAAACEMHPSAVLRGAELRSVRQQLAAATSDAEMAGINEVPALVVHGELFLGERAVEDAAERMRSVPTPAGPPGAPAR
jgi:2-hydroxychromene-2-carboxylate isomerase